jgi:uncharacterized membrane protein
MIEIYLTEWLSILMRWLHLIAGIAWVGASLHFIWLDNSLEEPEDEDKESGVKGSLWSIHGGGIYNFRKYELAPPVWPRLLHWSKWEAYSTWITGTLLMIAVYYFQATTYLVGPGKWLQDPSAAVLGSVVFISSGVFIYEGLIRSPLRHYSRLFALILIVFVALQCWLSTKLFSDRASFLHVGALLGTIMAGNVFLGIIPTQKRFVDAVQNGREPDARGAALAKQRSTHNNYFTLPVLFCMVSNHAPFIYSHPHNWLILISILAIVAYARHFFNLRHRGIIDYRILIFSIAAFLGLATWLAYEQFKPFEESPREIVFSNPVDVTEVHRILKVHCQVCHAAEPTHPGFVAPPAGVLMDDPAIYRKSASQILTAISTGYMPLGNVTGMTQIEREQVIYWLEQEIQSEVGG